MCFTKSHLLLSNSSISQKTHRLPVFPFLIESLFDFSNNWNCWSNAKSIYFCRSHTSCQSVPHLSLLLDLNRLNKTVCMLICFCVRTRTGAVISNEKEPVDANGERLRFDDVVLISNPRQILVGQNGWTKEMQHHVGHYARVCYIRDIARYGGTGIIPVECLSNGTDGRCSVTTTNFDVCSGAVLRIPQGTTYAQRPYYKDRDWLGV